MIQKIIKLIKSIRKFLRIKLYILRGKKPWSKGYHEYKRVMIKEIINNKKIIENFKQTENLPENFGIGIDERIVEYPWILSQIPTGENKKILDAGSTLNFEEIIDYHSIRNNSLTFINLYPETNCFIKKGISYVLGDIRDMPFKDSFFDFVTCISTLEHIGMDNTLVYTKEEKYNESKKSDYLSAVSEMLRVVKKNGIVLITVPFGKYENHGFFQQFNIEMINKINNLCNGNITTTYFHYNQSWKYIKDPENIKNASYFNTRTDSKNIKKLAAAEAVACLKIIKT